MYVLLLKKKIMKTINLKRILGATLLMFAVAYVSAVEPVISVSGGKKIALKIDEVSENTRLVIKDMNGYSFYSENVEKSSESFMKSFDLTTLPDGSYEIQVEESSKITSYPFSIVNNKVSFSLDDKTISYKPTIRQEDNKVFVSKFNPENKPLSITIYNSNNELVYEETLEGKLELGRIYNFSKVQGNYTIAIQSDEKTYSKNVTVE
jgi:hypothetical protein